ARERAGQVVAEGEGQAHLRLVGGDRNPFGWDVPRGLVDQPALADARLTIHDHRGGAPLAARPSHHGSDHLELVRAPEELRHAATLPGGRSLLDPREFPHDTSLRLLYRHPIDTVPAIGPDRGRERRCTHRWSRSG